MLAALDTWQMVFLGGAALLVLLQARRGWKLGVVRQLLSLVAIVAAYAVAIFGGPLFVPVLRPLGFPDTVLAIGAGVILGLVVFFLVNVIAAILFKKTAQQEAGAVRLSYGALGALIGALFGLVVVWVAVLGIRLLGTVAETELAAAARRPNAVAKTGRVSPPPEPGALIRGLAQLKHSLEQGSTGAMVERVDPIPPEVYEVLMKVGLMISNEESVARFLDYPGAKPLAQHPKIVALQSDPDIQRDVQEHNYVGLLRNERIVAAANDPEVAKLLRQFEFQKALDHAITTREPANPRERPPLLER